MVLSMVLNVVLNSISSSEAALSQLKLNRIVKFTTKFENVQIVLNLL